jgi:hypothetical protein
MKTTKQGNYSFSEEGHLVAYEHEGKALLIALGNGFETLEVY